MSERKAVFTVTETPTKDGMKSWWTKIGTAFTNKDGSLTVRLNALPINGVLQIREEEEKRGGHQ